MVAAVLEWFLWIAAFMYCLWKVFQKAEHWTVRVLAVVVAVAFVLLRYVSGTVYYPLLPQGLAKAPPKAKRDCCRCIFLPIMLVTLPLPSQIVKYWPNSMVAILQWFAFWSFAGLLTVPWLFCVYQIVTHQLGRTKRIKQVLDEISAPKVVIVMPCYKEEPDVLVTAINSVVDCDYPPSCIHVFLSFDGDQEDELYLNTIEKLGVPLTLESYPKSIDVTYKAARITVSRFPHGGKRHCQKATFKLIDKVYQAYLKRNDNLFILFIDSDCILDRVCLQNFVYDMELSPGNRRDMLAMTGVITSTTRKHSLITLLQDMEYVHGQLFERTVESGCGAVTCLPGALTMLRFSAFRRMAKYYFADKAEQCEDLFDFAKSHLGEDRWLTHLFMIGAKKRYQIQMCTSAFCKTEAVQTVRSLIKQRRRWFLGFITNEVCMLTDWRLWKKYPILILVRFMQNTIRTTALLFFIMVLALVTTAKRVADLPVGFIAISLGLNWLMMIYFGAKLRRFKLWLYPMMFVLNPFFNWYYMVYGIFTAGQRTWGGPRADAAAADSTTTAQEAIEIAEKTGDDLNIVPESFIPAAEAKKGKEVGPHGERRETRALGRARSLLQPPDKIAGKFSAPERTANGWYQHPDDSLAVVGVDDLVASSSAYGRQGNRQHRRDSFDSTFSAQTGNYSVYVPRRVESIMGDEDRRKYELAQSSQLNQFMSNSRLFQGPPPGQVYEFTDAELRRAGFLDSAESALQNGTGGNGGNGSSGGGAEVLGGGGAAVGNSAAGISSRPVNHHRRLASNDSVTSRTSSSGRNSQTSGVQQDSSGRTVVQPLMAPPPNSSSRPGRSPLARASWVQTSSTDDIEGATEESNGVSRYGSSRSGPSSGQGLGNERRAGQP
ncbi:hypothetical protein VTK73DRAFT_2874 [Phialemonium thermophilum]|uniref:chitin synthase n=1 Tax=Phialemonium thermophilum TaxID=223376 RepID=A0ABR3X288_9PEZI